MRLINIAQAHYQITDAGVSALIDIDPDDDPVIKQPATINYLFTKIGQQDFNIGQCNCQAIISKSGREIFSQQINSFSYNYTFPERGTYTLELRGAPSNAQSPVPNFDLKYDYTVTRESAATPPVTHNHTDHTAHFVLVGAAILIIGAMFIQEILKNKKTRK